MSPKRRLGVLVAPKTAYADLPPAAITDPGGTSPLVLVFRGTGSGERYDLDAITFEETS